MPYHAYPAVMSFETKEKKDKDPVLSPDKRSHTFTQGFENESALELTEKREIPKEGGNSWGLTQMKVDGKEEIFVDLSASKWDLVREYCPTIGINPLESVAHSLFGHYSDYFFLFVLRVNFFVWLIGVVGLFAGTILAWHFEEPIAYTILFVISVIFFSCVLLTMNVRVARFLIFKFESVVKIFSCFGLILSLPNTCNKPRVMDYTEGFLFFLYTLAFVFTDATNLMPKMNVLFGVCTLGCCFGLYFLIITERSGCEVIENPWLDFGISDEFSARQISLVCISQLIIFIGKQVFAELRDILLYQRDFCNSIKLPIKIEWQIPKADAERLGITTADAGVIDVDCSDSEEEYERNNKMGIIMSPRKPKNRQKKKFGKGGAKVIIKKE